MEKTSYNEIWDIINHMNSELYIKIPQKFLTFIKQNQVENYQVQIDYSKNINEQELQKDTRILLALIYRDYLCDSAEKESLLKKDQFKLEEIEQEKREKYNLDNSFIKNKQQESFEKNSQQMIEYKQETVFQKILNRIREFLNF